MTEQENAAGREGRERDMGYTPLPDAPQPEAKANALVMTASVRLRTMLQIDEAARATNQLFRARMSMPTGKNDRSSVSRWTRRRPT